MFTPRSSSTRWKRCGKAGRRKPTTLSVSISSMAGIRSTKVEVGNVMRDNDLLWFVCPDRNTGFVLTLNKEGEHVFHTFDVDDPDNRFWGHYFYHDPVGAYQYFHERLREYTESLVHSEKTRQR